MINLPKPSPLSLNGDAEKQVQYVVGYLSRLVNTLEKQLSVQTEETEEQKCIRDIGYSSNKFAITYTDGSVKYIDIGGQNG